MKASLLWLLAILVSGKLLVKYLKKYNVELLHEKKWILFEIQSHEVEEVSKYSAFYAAEKTGKDQ